MKKKFNLIKKYIFHYKKRTIETIIMLILAFTCFIFINQTVRNIQKIKYLNAAKESGYYHILYENASLNEFEQIRENDLVKEVGGEWVIGSVTDNANQFMLLYRDQIYNRLDSSLSNLIAGKNPTGDKDIVITRNHMERNKLEIGDKVSLEFEKINYDTGDLFYKYKETFTISGIIENWGKYEDIEIGIVSEELKNELIKTDFVDNTLIHFKREKDILSQSEELIKMINLQNVVKYNDELIFAIDDNTTIGNVRIVVNFLIFAIFGLILYNVVYFSILSDRKDLGIMTSLGMDKKVLYEIVTYRIVFYFVLAIPLGILSGVIVNNLLFEKFVAHFLGTESKQLLVDDFKVNVDIVLSSAIITLSILLPSLLGTLYYIFSDTPIEIINASNQDIEYYRRKTEESNKILFKNKLINYGFHNTLRNKKRTIITICIMIIAFSILSTMIIINNIGAKKDYSWIKKYVPGDICIEGNIDYNSIHDSKSFISRPNLESLERTKNIKSFNAYQIKSLFADIDFNNIDKNSTFYKENKTDIELNKDINGSYTTISTIAFVKKDLKKELEIKDDISPVIISKEFADMIQVKEGDFIYLKMYQEDRNEFTISEHFQVIKIMDEFPVYTKFHSTTEVIVDYDDLQNLYNTIGYDRIDIWLEDNTNLTSINNIKNLEFNSSVSIKTYNDTVKYFQERYIKKILFQIFVIGIFLFIAMANSFTSIFNNIVNRKEEFTLLNIIGISKGEIKRVVLLEGILYGVITSLAVIIIQVIIIIILGMKERSIYVIYTLLFVDLLIISTNILFSNISMNYIVRNQ